MITFPISMLMVVTAVIAFGTIYSVIFNTYLDTSDPLLTHLPHPLNHTHYFASKKNLLNVYFIKQAWLWTTGAFLFLFFTSPRAVRTKERILQYLVETGVWLVFTSWFFGSPLLDRLTISTGGECVVTLPSGAVVSLPQDFCYTKSTISAETHPSLFAAPLLMPEASWVAQPRLRRGHDVSGHLFLLTMSILFLSDQLRYSYAHPPNSSRQIAWSPLHKWAVGLNYIIILVSMFAVYTTSVYFHTPFEKLTGYVLGVSGFALTQLALFQSPTNSVPADPLDAVNPPISEVKAETVKSD